jgi:hypothetical protein
MSSKDLTEIYIQQLNDYVLPDIDVKILDISCNSQSNEYAKEILKRMHDVFVDVYGTDYLDSEYEFVELPAVVRGRNTGHIGIALVLLDVESSGEHWGTHFISPLGIIDTDDENLAPIKQSYLSEKFIPYDYWYTVELASDHHVDFENIPEQAADILNHCELDRPEMRME